MKTISLEVFPREATGKGAARKLRRMGLVPAVIYGHETIRNLAVRLKDLQQVLKSGGGSNSILDITVDGNKKTALLKDVQINPIQQLPIHADIFEVSMDQKIKVMVEVKSAGDTPVGCKKGGILTHALTEVEIECLPLEIPEFFQVDCSNLDVGDAIHVSDLPNLGVKVLTPEDQVLYSVLAPIVEEVAKPAEAVEGVVAEEGTAEGGEATAKAAAPEQKPGSKS
ncbi:MAG: 50S ribosomal protein L25 [bacterium]